MFTSFGHVQLRLKPSHFSQGETLQDLPFRGPLWGGPYRVSLFGTRLGRSCRVFLFGAHLGRPSRVSLFGARLGGTLQDLPFPGPVWGNLVGSPVSGAVWAHWWNGGLDTGHLPLLTSPGAWLHSLFGTPGSLAVRGPHLGDPGCALVQRDHGLRHVALAMDERRGHFPSGLYINGCGCVLERSLEAHAPLPPGPRDSSLGRATGRNLSSAGPSHRQPTTS